MIFYVSDYIKKDMQIKNAGKVRRLKKGTYYILSRLLPYISHSLQRLCNFQQAQFALVKLALGIL